MPDERPEETPGPRFGRRPRQSEAPAPGGEAPGLPKKLRIGPRRPEADAPPPPPPPAGILPPRGGVRKPKGQPQGQNPSNRDGASPDRPQGGIKRKQGRNKGRNRARDDQGTRSPGQGPRHPDPRQGAVQDRGSLAHPEGGEHPAMGDSSVFQGSDRVPAQNSPGVSRNARRRKRRKDRREQNPAQAPSAGDVFEPSVPFEPASPDEVSFESDETDFALPVVVPPTGVSTVFPDTSFPETSFIDDDGDEDDDETGSDLPVVDGAAPAEGAARESRSKRRRKKRRERQDPPQVDRGSGYWWAEQWMRSFEVLYGGGASRARLQKGRSYARRGQVTDLEVGPNGVIARVQGSRPKPYQVRLELNRLRRETWGRILHQLAGKAAFLAQLLEGTLPPEIEDVFFAAGARLFPHGDNDVRSRCTCPDPVVPCKHVAAVDYVLADALQRDPFLLFALRGKSRDQFLQDLRDMRGRENGRREPAALPDEDLSGFWRMGRLAESVLRPTGWGSGGDPARLIQSLGEPQLEGIREGLFLPMLESTYRQVSEGMRRLPKDD